MNMVRFWSPELSTRAKWSPKKSRKSPRVFSPNNPICRGNLKKNWVPGGLGFPVHCGNSTVSPYKCRDVRNRTGLAEPDRFIRKPNRKGSYPGLNRMEPVSCIVDISRNQIEPDRIGVEFKPDWIEPDWVSWGSLGERSPIGGGGSPPHLRRPKADLNGVSRKGGELLFPGSGRKVQNSLIGGKKCFWLERGIKVQNYCWGINLLFPPSAN